MTKILCVNVDAGLMYNICFENLELKGCSGKKVDIEVLELNGLRINGKYYEIAYQQGDYAVLMEIQ